MYNVQVCYSGLVGQPLLPKKGKRSGEQSYCPLMAYISLRYTQASFQSLHVQCCTKNGASSLLLIKRALVV